MTETSTTIDRPLGLDVRNLDNPYLRQVGVIGAIETTSTGNTVLRVGPTVDGGGWEQAAMVVLTPAERERLIGVLIAHREVSA